MAFKDLKEKDKLYIYKADKRLIKTLTVIKNNIGNILVDDNGKEETIKILNANNNQQITKNENGTHFYLRVNLIVEEKKKELKNCINCKSYELCKSKGYLIKNYETSFCTAHIFKEV